MSRREVTDCDGCSRANLAEYATVFVCTGRSMDPSGNGYEDEGGTVHLCVKCCEYRLATILADQSNEKNADLLKAIRESKRQSRIHL